MTDPGIELVYDDDCPNVDECREALRAALAEVGAPLTWKEWHRNADSTPRALRGFGSPTVLIDGHDICGDIGALTADADSCRVYQDECGCLCGAPSAKLIMSAIRKVESTWNRQ